MLTGTCVSAVPLPPPRSATERVELRSKHRAANPPGVRDYARLLSRSLRGLTGSVGGSARGTGSVGRSASSGVASRSGGIAGSSSGVTSSTRGVGGGFGSLTSGIACSGSSVLSGFSGRFLLRASDERERQRESSEDHFCIHVIYHPNVIDELTTVDSNSNLGDKLSR
jgi:hypothetical protein